MANEIKVVGGLGKSERRDRCVDRVLHRGGCVFCLPAHCSIDKPMVVKKYGKVDRHKTSDKTRFYPV